MKYLFFEIVEIIRNIFYAIAFMVIIPIVLIGWFIFWLYTTVTTSRD